MRQTHQIVCLVLVFIISLFIFLQVNAFVLNDISPIATYNYQRLLQLLCLILTVVFCLFNWRLHRGVLSIFQQFKSSTRMFMLVFFLCGILSASQALFKSYAFLQVATYYLLLIAGLAIAYLRQTMPEVFERMLLGAMGLALFVYGSYVLITDLQFVMNPQLWLQHHPKAVFDLLAPGFDNYRFLAQLLPVVLPLCVLPIMRKQQYHHFWRMFYFMVCALCWYLLILNHSRALWLEIIVVTIFMLSLWRKKSRDWLSWQFKAFIVALTFYVLLFYVIAFFTKAALPTKSALPISLNLSTSSGRIALWQYALHVIASRPLLGQGPLHFAYYFPYQHFNQWLAHPHNTILYLAAEWGLPACLCFLWVSIRAISHWLCAYRRQTDSDSDLYLALSAAAIMLGIQSLLSGVFLNPLGQSCLMVLGGWMLGLMLEGFPQNTNKSVSIASLIISPLLLLLAVTGLICGVYYDVGHWQTVQAASLFVLCVQNHVSCVYTSGYWLQSRLKILAALHYFS